MNILGISAFFHDSAAALVSDQEGILAAAEEERFTRKKHDHNFPMNSINYCMKESGLVYSEIDLVAFYEEPWSKLNRVCYNYLKTLFKTDIKLGEIASGWINQKLWVREFIVNNLGLPSHKIKFFPHHLSHAYSAFGPSGFDSAACLTLDGVGEWETATFGVFEDGNYKKIRSHFFPNSLGLLYSAFAEFLGFEVNDGEFKVMGMAAYGTPKYKDKIEKLFTKKSGIEIEIDMSFFVFDRSNKTNLSRKFADSFGPSREKESQFLSADLDVISFNNSKELILDSQKYYADIAASLQAVFEEIVLDMVQEIHDLTGKEKLVYAGGVALNSVVNGRIVQESKFKEVFIQPAAGDSGGALGAAFCALGPALYANRDTFYYKTGSLGQAYTRAEIEKSIHTNKISNFQEWSCTEELTKELVKRILKGEVGALMRGGFEFGPRALGNRSIIADPRTSKMKARVNHAVKFRELFRPFAPIVTKEAASIFFDFRAPEKIDSQPFAFMMGVTRVRETARSQLEAVTHVDGTARVQIVHEENDPFLHGLLSEFGKVSGVPVLMNTSFNRRGEPIVNSPDEAISAFLWTDIDFLVMETFVLFKSP